MGAPAAQGLLGQGGPMDWGMVQHILGLNNSSSPLMMPYDPNMMLAQGDGISAQTKKGLVDSAGFDPHIDFGDNATPQAPQYYQGAPTSKKAYNPREMTQQEHDAEQARLNRESDAAYQRYLQSRHKR